MSEKTLDEALKEMPKEQYQQLEKAFEKQFMAGAGADITMLSKRKDGRYVEYMTNDRFFWFLMGFLNAFFALKKFKAEESEESEPEKQSHLRLVNEICNHETAGSCLSIAVARKEEECSHAVFNEDGSISCQKSAEKQSDSPEKTEN